MSDSLRLLIEQRFNQVDMAQLKLQSAIERTDERAIRCEQHQKERDDEQSKLLARHDERLDALERARAKDKGIAAGLTAAAAAGGAGITKLLGLFSDN